ncbi:MAG: PEP-CTERM sorting domain-containing protein [Woeseiaceae bacterium]
MFKRITLTLTAFAFSAMAQATLIDFTDANWQAAIGSGNSSATLGNVTLSTGNPYHILNFNSSSSEIKGCAAGADVHDLACLGDGIGIRRKWNNNDEISGSERLLIEFAKAVDVTKIYLLDLFGEEKYGKDEKAIIFNSNGIKKTVNGAVGVAGGFLSVEYSLNEGGGLSSILLKGYRDCFSDFALAGLEVTPSAVPVPGAAILFGSALLGFFGFKRRQAA